MTIHSSIVNAIKRCNLVFFVGAGFSVPLGLPTWRKLINIITDELKVDYPDRKYIQVISEMIHQGDFTEIEALDKLKEKHFDKILEITERAINISFEGKDLSRHERLWKITDQIVTTNYDKAFEQVASERIEKVVYKDNFRIARLSGLERFLFKVHGCVERPEECVLFSNQYQKLYDLKTGASLELFKILSDKTIIFIGFSLSDPFVNELLELRKKAYSDLKPKNFIITTEDKDFDKFGIEKIAGINNYGEDIDALFDELLLIRGKYPYGLGMLMRGLEKEGKEFNEEELRRKYFELIGPMEINPSAAAVVEEIKAGEFENAEEKLIQELEEDLRYIDQKKESAAKKTFDLARLKDIQIDYYQALKYYEQAFSLEPDNSLYCNELGHSLNSLGRHSEALQYYEKALAIDLQNYGEKHKDVAICINNVGQVWFDLQEYEKARQYFEKAITLFKEIGGEKNKHVAISLSNLAKTFHGLEDYNSALEYGEKALAIDLELFGNVHRNVAIRLNNIGSYWNSLGDKKKAIENIERALTIDKEVLPENHPDISVDHYNLASVLYELGDFDKALTHAEDALAIVLKVFGENHRITAYIIVLIGALHCEYKDWSKALHLFERGLEIRINTVGKDHSDTKTIIEWIELCQLKIKETP
jgi:tetratricopeptide (TPR) repeat protein